MAMFSPQYSLLNTHYSPLCATRSLAKWPGPCRSGSTRLGANRNTASGSALVWAYARAGRRADALRLLEELKKRDKAGYVPSAAMLNSYIALGENDKAFAWFERACQEQSNLLRFIKVFPPFDPVRGDPRFQEIVRRVGLN